MRRVVHLLLVALTAPGCLVASLHPAYDRSTIRFDPALLGAWQDEDRQFALVVESGPWQSYKVKVTAQSRETALTGYQFTIGQSRFVDLTAERGLEEGPVVLPTHAVAQLSVTGDRLELRPLDYDWFRRALEERSLKELSATLDERDNVLVTAPAAELRPWIQSNHRREGVLGPPLRFVRRR
jgi:hypothetical protein